MGTLIGGVWNPDVEPLSFVDGRFIRPPATLRAWVQRDPAADYPVEPGRYHLYVFAGCPWAHRAWLVHSMLRLHGAVGISMVARMGPHGWMFDPTSADHRDGLHGRTHLHEVYSAGAPGYTGRATVPVLWDELSHTIVNNESADIVRMFNDAFAHLAARPHDFYPAALRAEIDALNERIYHGLNNGVYRAGFARTREAHLEARSDVFATLDWLDQRLAARRYLCGDELTEADVRLFPTLARFDAAYVSAFGCNLQHLDDFENLSRYARDVYRIPGVSDTVMPPAFYSRGYHSIPIAIGHTTTPPASPEHHAFEAAAPIRRTA